MLYVVGIIHLHVSLPFPSAWPPCRSVLPGEATEAYCIAFDRPSVSIPRPGKTELTGRAGDVGQMESELKAHPNGDAEAGDKIVTSFVQVGGIFSSEIKYLINRSL